MSLIHRWIQNGILLSVSLSGTGSLSAAPITFNTALPVAKGAFINREQVIVKRLKDDGPMNRDLEVTGILSLIGYGMTPKLAVFTAIPYLNKSLDLTIKDQKFSRSSESIGDVRMFARYTLLQQDERSKTFRIAGFGGLKAPTGKDNKTDNLGRLPIPMQTGSGAWDSFAGLVMTYQTLDYQIDSQLNFEKNGRANHFQAGNEIRADISFQYRLFPQQMSSNTHSFVYGVMEANLINQKKHRISGESDPDSGGTILYLTPGIQYVTSKYILEAAVQLPAIEKLHGNALETDYIFTTGFRINF